MTITTTAPTVKRAPDARIEAPAERGHARARRARSRWSRAARARRVRGARRSRTPMPIAPGARVGAAAKRHHAAIDGEPEADRERLAEDLRVPHRVLRLDRDARRWPTPWRAATTRERKTRNAVAHERDHDRAVQRASARPRSRASCAAAPRGEAGNRSAGTRSRSWAGTGSCRRPRGSPASGTPRRARSRGSGCSSSRRADAP